MTTTATTPPTGTDPASLSRPVAVLLGLLGDGFPVRMVVPGIYGYLSGCTWLTDIEVTTWDARQGYWEQRAGPGRPG